MEINLVSVMGTDPILSHHCIKHYKSLGIENFYIVLWGDSNKAPYREVIEVVKSHDINYTLIFYLDETVGDASFLTDLYNSVISLKKDQWWVVADHDELAIFPKPIATFIEEDLENQEFAFGLMLDRIGPGGKFVDLGYEDDIWTTFPLAGYINRYVRGNDVRTVPLLKGSCKLHDGQHGLLEPIDMTNLGMSWEDYIKGKIWWPPKVEIHHFKWRKADIKLNLDYSELGPTWWGHENKKVYDYMLESGGIDITDTRFKVEEYKDKYSRWEEISKIRPFDY
ncbi:hypothetical protein CMI38_00900 [Candidatus Pacearchaeota archaeon]|jgi:hypothetical protein|nr:hypothetical protein [Candidatus Pacearchaeota archaeon]|tara:strand:- start:4555 stop:5397 length:843 start_codon:yes stop_codon:yes gene_type:complete